MYCIGCDKDDMEFCGIKFGNKLCPDCYATATNIEDDYEEDLRLFRELEK